MVGQDFKIFNVSKATIASLKDKPLPTSFATLPNNSLKISQTSSEFVISLILFLFRSTIFIVLNDISLIRNLAQELRVCLDRFSFEFSHIISPLFIMQSVGELLDFFVLFCIY